MLEIIRHKLIWKLFHEILSDGLYKRLSDVTQYITFIDLEAGNIFYLYKTLTQYPNKNQKKLMISSLLPLKTNDFIVNFYK